MVEDQQEPAWIAELSEAQPGMVEEPREQGVQAGTVEDLREQMIQAEEGLDVEGTAPVTQLFLNLEPWQRLLLAVLLFLNVALCGCMALVMAGRVAFP
jgi:hypothetical protein